MSMDPEQQGRTMAYTSHALLRIFEWSQRSWLGKASVKVVGSGRYRSPHNERPVDLVRVDARSGKTQRIDRGTIGMTLEPAPAGQRVAYLRKVGSFAMRSEEQTSELQSIMRKSYAVFCV